MDYIGNEKVAKMILKSEQKNEFLQRTMDKMIVKTFILISCIKVLLFPTYHSTDFEVHRNWLAITHSLPLEEWYINDKSEWTLDYPPFFAWFEYLLSQIAYFIDIEMLKVDNLNYASPATILFQRSTVMFADLVLALGVREICKQFHKSQNCSTIFTVLSLCNMGLLVIDHIHFQYNGFLIGILLLSIAKVSSVCKTTQVLQGAMWFAILLNFKHVYLYIAPAYVIWLLRWSMKDSQFFHRISSLAFIVLTVFALSFGPFVSQMPRVLARLFPFKRGLVHAYWAANGWAIYIGLDKVLSLFLKYLGWTGATKTAVMTGGLVQEQSFSVLPTPTPLITFIISFATMIPALWFLMFQTDFHIRPKKLIRCIILCGLSSFTFGWHVHEKAILTVIIPLGILAVIDANDSRIFIILSSTGQTALLPLLYPENLSLLKLLLSVIYMIMSALLLCRHFKDKLLCTHEWLYVSSLPMFTIYETLIHKCLFGKKLPFLPLALTSIYCAIGVTYCWIIYYYIYLTDNKKEINLTEVKENVQLEGKSKSQKIL
ncbi:dolichyl pyrophosphate Glc1Man9GlcNAc2 alpha-1,3-glucosyltransferase isoform X1 [Prorops nasuta]|uniref:dolichyl pyrophosphate Glc1Man9GlcNAc2 alpha-1,3-glucosyltransferase isoform X1 n=1 Tax=Prorops nasuta TaxID=863751 RepID=UPI0034CD6244